MSSRLCDGAVVAFGLWTVSCHAVVAAGGSLFQLVWVYAVVAALAVGLSRRRRRATAPPETECEPAPPRRRGLRWVQATGLLLGILAWQSEGDLWWRVVLILAAAAVFFLIVEAPAVVAPLRGRGPETALIAIVAMCAVATLVAHRPDLDDAFYVNLAVSAADRPDAPLLVTDGMLGVPGLPLHMPAHRVHTYELWNGALSYLTGIPAIYCFHIVSALLAAALVPLAHAALFRLLAPQVWPWTVFALVFVLLAAGETHRWYGNFAFVRMWQGKGVALFVFLPLVYAYAIRFALRPTVPRWLLLAAAQAAALGCSSSAIWAAPVGAGVAMASVLRPSASGIRTLAVGALASSYVLLVGVTLRSEMQSLVAPVLEVSQIVRDLVAALTTALGEGDLLSFGMLAVTIAWACCPRGLGQRFAIAAPLAVFLVLLNPALATWVVENVTGPSYWRSTWALPIPILMALLLTAPLHLAREGAGRWLARLACVAFLAVFALTVPRYGALSERNNGGGGLEMRLGRPGLKVPEREYRWAAALNASVAPGATVLAPAPVGPWIGTFHHHAHPLQARRMYLTRHLDHLGEEDVQWRRAMTLYAGARGPRLGTPAHFRRGLEMYDVAGVLLAKPEVAGEARRVLRAAGFHRTVRAIDGEIWVRDPGAAPPS